MQLIRETARSFGTQQVYQFDNGWQASVLFDAEGELHWDHDGYYEVAVMKEGELNYKTDVTGDIVAWLTPTKLKAILAAIGAMSRKGKLPRGYVRDWE